MYVIAIMGTIADARNAQSILILLILLSARRTMGDTIEGIDITSLYIGLLSLHVHV